MSYTSSLGTTPATSPSSSLPPTARSIQIGFSRGSNTPVDIYRSSSPAPSHPALYAFSSASYNKSNSRPNSYVSDEDLFGDDDAAPYMRGPPPPPRPASAWGAMAQPLLPPLPQPRRRSSTQKEKKRRSGSSASSNK